MLIDVLIVISNLLFLICGFILGRSKKDIQPVYTYNKLSDLLNHDEEAVVPDERSDA